MDQLLWGQRGRWEQQSRMVAGGSGAGGTGILTGDRKAPRQLLESPGWVLERNPKENWQIVPSVRSRKKGYCGGCVRNWEVGVIGTESSREGVRYAPGIRVEDLRARGDSDGMECVDWIGSLEVISGTRKCSAELWGVKKGIVKGCTFPLLSAPSPPPEPRGPRPPFRGGLQYRRIQGVDGRAASQVRQLTRTL